LIKNKSYIFNPFATSDLYCGRT